MTKEKLYKYLVKQYFTEGKQKILKTLLKEPLTLQDICKKTGMSLPLVCYHLNGNKQCDYTGLEELGTVITERERGQLKKVFLTRLGIELLKGVEE